MFLRVFFAFVTCYLISTPILAQDIRYEAVWYEGQETSHSTGLLSLSDFVNIGEELVGNGLRLIDVETEMSNGQRVYAGLWVKGTGNNIMDGPIGPIDFGNKMREMRDLGMRLVDFEIFRRENGGRLYLGVWRPGSGTETLVGPMKVDTFLAHGDRLIADGLRLVDVEIERIGDDLLYSGLFQTGTGSNVITAPLRRQAFRLKRDEMVAQGLELIDMERIVYSGRDRFVGVWANGPGTSRISKPRNFGPFFIFTQDQYNDEKHAVDLELVAKPNGSTTDDDEDERTGGSSDPSASVNDLPPNPQWVQFSGSTRLVIDFGLFIDGHPRVTLPINFLPEFLPLNGDNEVMLPNNLCGFKVIQAGSFNWQTQTGNVVTVFPYVEVENVADLGANDFNGGINFTGPIGACADDDDSPWQFFQPITQNGADSPVPDMKLVIEMRQGSEIEFLNFNIDPTLEMEDHLQPLDLFKDDVFERLVQIAEAFEETGEDNGYCPNVSMYMAKVCDDNPGICPVSNPQDGC